MAVSVENLGMSLLQMGKESDSVRFLDDVDMTLSMANRSGELQNLMSIEVSSRPITFRASYRDINLILAIVNRALLLATPPADTSTSSKVSVPSTKGSLSPSEVGTTSGRRIGGGAAQVIMAKEQVRTLFSGKIKTLS
jgi:vacuolar protein sorting-associated protein 13A/C